MSLTQNFLLLSLPFTQVELWLTVLGLEEQCEAAQSSLGTAVIGLHRVLPVLSPSQEERLLNRMLKRSINRSLRSSLLWSSFPFLLYSQPY